MSDQADGSWWRRNRWALLALPVLAVLAAAANGIRVQDYWWDRGLHDRVQAPDGRFVSFRQDFSDSIGPMSRSLRVRLDQVSRVSQIPQEYGDPTPIPAGVTGWQVRMSFEADPDQQLRGCQLALRSDDGERFEFAASIDTLAQRNASPCLNLGEEGPTTAFLKGMKRRQPEGEERPGRWSTSSIVLVPEGTEIRQVLMWWEKPRYLQWQVPD